ncbi:MAG: hypothetical protein NTU91_01150 [Chloroflexi bacterium]|nr:hypothetical protein [Chloroflexota bacterium]
MIKFKTSVYFYHGGAWVLCSDVLQDPAPSWGFGLPGNGPMDLVADTGILTFTLDNTTSNSAGLSGCYSTGHPNCPAWFVDGLPIKVVCERQDTFASATRFLGEMVDARPTSGVFEEATVEVEAHDWMEYASIQKLGQLAIQTSKRVDQALTTALLNFPATRQPAATDFDVGKETFAAIFNTDNSDKQKMASLFQKLARNEGGGFIFLEGDGTLRFDNRHARPMTTAAAFTLDATAATPMNELDVSWRREEVKNRIEAKMWPAKVDTGADTIIWKLQKTSPLSAGQVLVLTCGYRDPVTGARISASAVVNPLVGGTHIKFGSADDGATNDLIGSLTFPMVVGGNSAEITLTAAVAGYVNFIELWGDGIYTYDPMVLGAEDAASILLRGERVLEVSLEQITSPSMAQSYATSLRDQLHDPARKVEKVKFLANFSNEFATAALTAEVNTRFAVKETQTDTDAELFVCRLKYEQVGPLLWVEIVPAPAATVNYFIWDVAGHGWDQGVWAF